MRRNVARILLLLFLWGACLPVEAKVFLGSLPVLAAHYQDHLRQHPSLSVRDFLQLHYGERFKDHQGEHDHSRLPLKQNGHLQPLPIQPAVVPEHMLPGWSFELLPARRLSDARTSLPFHGPFRIWQPPRA